MKKIISYYQIVKSYLRKLKPSQALVLGFISYITGGIVFISLPFSTNQSVSFLDNLFNIVSAVSTTGLTINSLKDSYTKFGQLVFLFMFQLGGIGYMAISSFIIIGSGNILSKTRENILSSEYTIPKGFNIKDFVFKTIIFTFIIEFLGTIILYIEFRNSDIENPFWSALFHCISAFATAGFSINNNSLEDFKFNSIVNITIGILCYLGAIGFIVIEDLWFTIRRKDYKITFTSKMILLITFVILFIETPIFFIIEPSIKNYSFTEKLLISFFQIMTASTTAGFNTISIGDLKSSSLSLIIFAMVIGASPSGTGGGIKTTSLSALLAVTLSILKGQTYISLFQNRVPLIRLFTAVSSVTLYLLTLLLGIFCLTISEDQDFIKIVFEAASALGTVGLSMGITGDLTGIGKVIIIILMFLGRISPLTLGLALLYSPEERDPVYDSDIAV